MVEVVLVTVMVVVAAVEAVVVVVMYWQVAEGGVEWGVKCEKSVDVA